MNMHTLLNSVSDATLADAPHASYARDFSETHEDIIDEIYSVNDEKFMTETEREAYLKVLAKEIGITCTFIGNQEKSHDDLR